MPRTRKQAISAAEPDQPHVKLATKPLTGSLFKRRGRKYLPANSKEEGTFYFKFNPRTEASIKSVTINLKTTDIYEARMRADALCWKAYQYAEEIYARALMAPSTLGVQKASPRSMTKDMIARSRLSLDSMWKFFVDKYQVKDRSMVSYKQLWDRFLKFAKRRGCKYTDDITRKIAEDYTKDVFAKKVTAKKDIQHLARMWSTIFPDIPVNPWNTGLHLQPRKLDKACNYRCVMAGEVRKIKKELVKRSSEGAYRKSYKDLSKAIYFSWWYGMRIGSVANLKWDDFVSDDYFCHCPPKTDSRKPTPLELPIVPEIKQLLGTLEGAWDKKGWLFPALHDMYVNHPQHLANSIKNVFISAGVNDDARRGRASWHSMRASFITQMDEHKVVSGITDSITGHAPKTMHDRYSHASIEAKRTSIIDSIEPLNKEDEEEVRVEPELIPEVAEANDDIEDMEEVEQVEVEGEEPEMEMPEVDEANEDTEEEDDIDTVDLSAIVQTPHVIDAVS